MHGLHVPLDDMGMVESIHLCLFHWVLNDVFARINHEGRYAAGGAGLFVVESTKVERRGCGGRRLLRGFLAVGDGGETG